MDTVRLVAQQRLELGKGSARRLRKSGKLPAVVYGRGDSKALMVDAKELFLIRQTGGANTIIDLTIDGSEVEECSVILREMQIDPISRSQVHADFYRVDLNEAITVAVALEFINLPEDRLKAAQLELSILTRELTVECLPREIPSLIVVDLADLDAGVVVHAGDVTLPASVRLVTNAEEGVASTAAVAVLAEAEDTEDVIMPAADSGDAPAEAHAVEGEESE